MRSTPAYFGKNGSFTRLILEVNFALSSFLEFNYCSFFTKTQKAKVKSDSCVK